MRAACLNCEEKYEFGVNFRAELHCGVVLNGGIGSAQHVQFAGGSADVSRWRGLDCRPEQQAGTPGQNSARTRSSGADCAMMCGQLIGPRWVVHLEY
jgi:hypothetical protein